MKTIHFSAFLFSCFLFLKYIDAVQYKTFTTCNSTNQYLYGDDSYSITWSIPTGNNACNLPMNFLTYRTVDFSLTYTSSASTTCYVNSYNWNCNSGSMTSCPVVMYSLSSYYNTGTSIDKFSTKTVYSDYVKLQYCGTPGMKTTVNIYVYSNVYYWYWSSSWQFVYIGIPIISISVFILCVVIYILRRNRRNRMMIQQSLLRPTVAITTTTSGGNTNMGYQATYAANQPYYYPPQQQAYNDGNQANVPPAYNPPGYNQSGYIQATPMKQ